MGVEVIDLLLVCVYTESANSQQSWPMLFLLTLGFSTNHIILFRPSVSITCHNLHLV